MTEAPKIRSGFQYKHHIGSPAEVPRTSALTFPRTHRRNIQGHPPVSTSPGHLASAGQRTGRWR